MSNNKFDTPPIFITLYPDHLLMRRCLIISLLLLPAIVAVARQWRPDCLGDGYQMTVIEQPDDYSGKVVTTVVRKLSPCGDSTAVLYVHGFNDYFFQKEMGDRFVDSCYNFYAVDLRKYGRSLLPGQKPYQARDIKEYYADLDSALLVMRQDGQRRVILMGHSTGGLITSSFLNHDPDTAMVKALILNSPFLEWNMGAFTRKVGVPLVSFMGRLFPNMSISQGDDTSYGKSLSKDYYGRWEFDTNLKTIHPRKVTAGWIRAITRAQSDLHSHSDIKTPILLMHSDHSVTDGKTPDDFQSGDAVLNVRDIIKWGNKLGPDVTDVTVKDGLHDLILSRPDVSDNAYKAIFQFINNQGLDERAKK